MRKADNFRIVEVGASYFLPKYRVVDGEGIKQVVDLFVKHPVQMSDRPDAYQSIMFVRGDKTDNGQYIPRVDGITHEQLLGTMIYDLQHKHSLIPSKETANAIEHLKTALNWLEERQKERVARNVEGTYQK
jgi:hypothetical protein